MAKYALIDGTIVNSVVVANSEEGLGVMAQLFEVIDVTAIVPQPSKDWSYEGGIFTHLSYQTQLRLCGMVKHSQTLTLSTQRL